MKAAQWRSLVAANIKAKRDAENLAIIPAAPPVFCKDCAHHSAEFDREKGRIRHYCAAPALLSMITGEKSNPASNRNTETLCGREARHFMRRPVTIEQAPIRNASSERPMLAFNIPTKESQT